MAGQFKLSPANKSRLMPSDTAWDSWLTDPEQAPFPHPTETGTETGGEQVVTAPTFARQPFWFRIQYNGIYAQYIVIGKCLSLYPKWRRWLRPYTITITANVCSVSMQQSSDRDGPCLLVGVACNYVLYANLSGGHYCMCNNVRRTVLHMQSCPLGRCCIMQLCPPGHICICSCVRPHFLQAQCMLWTTWENFGRWVYNYSMRS